jgi:squalene-associated FAD-dependent desaturase
VAVVGGGWAGLAAAVRARLDGHHVTVFEASRHWGGRARTVTVTLPTDGPGPWKRGDPLKLDNGQHILIGAYTETLRLMQLVGVDLDHALLRQPLRLTYPDGSGLALPDWPAPLDVLAGVVTAKGWHWSDKLALLRTALSWQWAHFTCPAHATVDELCARMPQRLRDEFIDPLCISALNTPAHQASGQVFLRVLKDAMFGTPKGSNLLLPRQPLGELWPQAAVRWLQQGDHPADLRLGNRVQSLSRTLSGTDWQGTWQVNGEVFDHVVWATSPSKVDSSLVQKALSAMHINTESGHSDTALAFEAIATVYAWAPAHTRPTTLPHPMLALRSDSHHPAQFVFDRGQLGGPASLLAFVVSASDCSAHGLSAAVVRQARTQLGWDIHPIQTIVEKRATFACTPGMYRPPMHMAPGLVLAGDHVQGPYPATLEGAMRCGWAAGEVQLAYSR